MAPRQIAACVVAAGVLTTAMSVTAPGQDVAKGLRCMLTEDARLDELEAVGSEVVRGLGSVQGPERISHCRHLPDVAVAFYLHGDPKRPARWRSEVNETLARTATENDDYELTTGYPVRTADGYVLPVTVAFAGHPRYRLSD